MKFRRFKGRRRVSASSIQIDDQNMTNLIGSRLSSWNIENDLYFNDPANRDIVITNAESYKGDEKVENGEDNITKKVKVKLKERGKDKNFELNSANDPNITYRSDRSSKNHTMSDSDTDKHVGSMDDETHTATFSSRN
ncbi:unnamed protein product [Gordionus sp. m RMFG-2023]